MAVTFPTSPTNGQQLTVNGKTYTFTSASGTWNITGADNPIDILFTRSEFVATANQTTFSVTYNTDYPIEVFVNGLQYLASDYTATNGTSVVFNTGLPADAEVVIMYATSSLSTIPIDISDLTDDDNLLSSGGGATTYANLSAFPLSGNTAGDFGFASDTKSLYVWDGSEWKRVYVGPDEQLFFNNQIQDSYLVSGINGLDVVVDASATDPEGFPVTYDYLVNPSSQTHATITDNQDGTFSITPTTDINNAGSFSIKFKATDGLNILTKTSSISVVFEPELIVGPYQIHSGTAFGTNPLGGTSDPAAVFSTLTADHWHSTNSGTRSWGYDFGENTQYELTSYKLMQRYSGIYHGMTAWTTQGSNDNTNWTTIDSRTGITFSSPPQGNVADNEQYYQEYTIPEADRAVYRYIRILYVDGTGYQVIGSVELYGHNYNP